jgi:Na+-transporting methylmalonyl-CoA/oxaloacetate decarboxylase gamma subunit
MQLADTIIGAAGDLLVLIALVVAVRALGTANEARADALKAENEAAEARRESVAREIEAQKVAEQAAADADRRAREAAKRDEKAADRQVAIHRMTVLERRRERVVQIGALVEQLFSLVEPSSRGETVAPQTWMPYRNHLGQLLVGLCHARNSPSASRQVLIT